VGSSHRDLISCLCAEGHALAPLTGTLADHPGAIGTLFWSDPDPEKNRSLDESLSALARFLHITHNPYITRNHSLKSILDAVGHDGKESRAAGFSSPVLSNSNARSEC
jgi:hypothetical protein